MSGLPRKCPECFGSRFKDAAIYIGDYHSMPRPHDWDERWQCIRCGRFWKKGPHQLLLDEGRG